MTPPNAVPPIPEGCSTVMPWIISRDTAKLLDFMKHAFGAQEISRMYNEDGTIGHAETKLVIRSSEALMPERGGRIPLARLASVR